jgi:predicted ATPase
MSKIIIKNIGPLKEVELNLNKINVLMGPQSTGKSTISKIISYFQWVEKRYILDGEYKQEFSKQFIDFHKIDANYFMNNSFMQYESNYVLITYEGKKGNQSIEDLSDFINYKKAKNIYIPAERNFVASIPNLRRYNEADDNIMSFLYDWYDVKKKYSKNKKLDVLNLGASFYHIKDSDSDIIKLDDKKVEISLRNASSGLQSVVPLIMLIEYLTESVLLEEKPLSVNEKFQFFEKNEDALKKHLRKEVNELKELNNIMSTKYTLSQIDEIRNTELEFKKKSDDIEELLNIFYNKGKEWKKYEYSQIIVEEPEQNLFPSTQKSLIYYLLQRINLVKEHTLILTTHSPYILYALNNCIMAFLINEKLTPTEKKKLECIKSKINPRDISIYEIENGKIKLIQDENGLIGENYFDNQMKKVMDEFYVMLNHY